MASRCSRPRLKQQNALPSGEITSPPQTQTTRVTARTDPQDAIRPTSWITTSPRRRQIIYQLRTGACPILGGHEHNVVHHSRTSNRPLHISSPARDSPPPSTSDPSGPIPRPHYGTSRHTSPVPRPRHSRWRPYLSPLQLSDKLFPNEENHIGGYRQPRSN